MAPPGLGEGIISTGDSTGGDGSIVLEGGPTTGGVGSEGRLGVDGVVGPAGVDGVVGPDGVDGELGPVGVDGVVGLPPPPPLLLLPGMDMESDPYSAVCNRRAKSSAVLRS